MSPSFRAMLASRSSCPGREYKPALLLVADDRTLAEFPSALQSLKLRLLHQALHTFCEAHFKGPLRDAAEQAARLALATGYPLLTFPELFRELAIPAMAKSECRVFSNVGFDW